MKRFSAQFRKQSESIRMRDIERTHLRDRVVSYMEYHPLPKEVVYAKENITEGIISEPFKVFKFNPLYVRSIIRMCALFIVVSVPALAENAVPGDILYPVKVEFNEELRSSLAFSPYQKVVWETQRMERRIAEARLLASEGKLTIETQDEVAKAVKQHSDAAQREIAQLRESDSDKAAIAEITFASALAVQSEVLDKHVAGEVTQTGVHDGRSVATLAQAVAQARTSAEALQNNSSLSYEKLLGRIEIESTHAYELFVSVQKTASDEEVRNIERRLSDIKRKIAKAQEVKEGKQKQTSMISLRDTQDEVVDETASTTIAMDVEATTLLRATLMDIQKLVNYMTHIDVRRNVSIEQLIPITLTDEELRTEITAVLNETITLQNTIGLRKPATPRQEKVTMGQTELESKLSDVVSLFELGLFEEAFALLKQAHEIAVDLERMTQGDPLKEIPQIIEEKATSTDVESTSAVSGVQSTQ